MKQIAGEASGKAIGTKPEKDTRKLMYPSKIYGTFGLSAEYSSLEEFEKAVRDCLDENDTSNDNIDFTLRGAEFLEQVGGVEWEELEDWQTEDWQDDFIVAYRKAFLDRGIQPPKREFKLHTPWEIEDLEEFYHEDPHIAGKQWAIKVMNDF